MTSLTLSQTAIGRVRIFSDPWTPWVKAIRALVNLQSLAIDYDSTQPINSLLTLPTPVTVFPNLLSLSIHTLHVSESTTCEMIPTTLTKLEISSVYGIRKEITRQLVNRILTMDQLVSLTIPQNAFDDAKQYYALRHLPATLHNLVVIGNYYDIPVDVIHDLSVD